MKGGGEVVWLTGPPACGKTTVAEAVVARLGPGALLLDSDALRAVLTPEPTYDAAERDRFYAQLAGLAALHAESGATVVVAATASRRRYRDAARARVERFLEVYLYAPGAVLEARDPKGLYAAARAGKIDTLPGRGADYEPPEHPDLEFDTNEEGVDTVADAIVARLRGEGGTGIRPAHVQRYLNEHGYAGAVLKGLTPLGEEVQESLKAHGYGHPLRVTFEQGGAQRDVTLRTMGVDAFGHERRADRFDGLALAFDDFGNYRRHVAPLDFGFVDRRGRMQSIADGEPFLLTTYVDGELYAHDLTRLAKLAEPTVLDATRASALAYYLAEMHAERRPASERRRATRDLVGHGEGIFGLVDAFDPADPIATPRRLRSIEHAAVDWLWRLRDGDDRSRRTHGDFHPFNILFADGADFTVLDASRGGAGDPADDVTALSINYAFFALSTNGAFDGALRQVWDLFWRVYLERTGDDEVLQLVAPYFAWRALVLVCPAWYPNLAPELRERILRFAEALLGGEAFDPSKAFANQRASKP